MLRLAGAPLAVLLAAPVLLPAPTAPPVASSSRNASSLSAPAPAPQYTIYWALGNPAWAPTPYDVASFGIVPDATIVFDVSAGAGSPWPKLICTDRGPDGKPCAGPSSEPCYNFSFVEADCTKAGGVRRDAPWATAAGLPPVLCCNPGGCTPAEGSRVKIKAQVAGTVAGKVPGNFSGNAVLDVEGWNPIASPDIFGSCNTAETGRSTTSAAWFMEQGLRNYSVAAVMHEQPALTKPQAVAVAQMRFSGAAADILVAALEGAKATRPLARWGYFGEVGLCNLDGPCVDPTTEFAAGGSDPLCGYDHPTAGPRLHAQAEAQRPIWAASDALFPAIYFQSVQPGGVIGSYACDNQHFTGSACKNLTLADQRAVAHSAVARVSARQLSMRAQLLGVDLSVRRPS